MGVVFPAVPLRSLNGSSKGSTGEICDACRTAESFLALILLPCSVSLHVMTALETASGAVELVVRLTVGGTFGSRQRRRQAVDDSAIGRLRPPPAAVSFTLDGSGDSVVAWRDPTALIGLASSAKLNRAGSA